MSCTLSKPEPEGTLSSDLLDSILVHSGLIREAKVVEGGLVHVQLKVLLKVLTDALGRGRCLSKRLGEKPRQATEAWHDVAHIVVVRCRGGSSSSPRSELHTV